MSTITVPVTLVVTSTEVTVREMGRKRQMEERHTMVDKVQRLCIQYMILVTFSQHGYFLVYFTS